ncbi:MAG TPA: class I SAM-dependent rRNA methyltransferase [Bacteroidales bacterium]|nr:class I SAM-dependent rRNA methyltransferase [Bacteroidales bacterium]
MPNDLPKVILKSGRDRALRRYHLWVFSGAIQSISGKPDEGEMVEIFSASGDYLATGHIQSGSIMVRIVSFERTDGGEDFWRHKIEQALAVRKTLGFVDNPKTNVFRLIHGEGDGMPGLIVDYYNGVVVLQAHDTGMWRRRQIFANILGSLSRLKVHAVYDKSENTLNTASEQDGFLFGNADAVEVVENGHRFIIDFREGQKTGFFIDQRENRRLLGNYAQGKKVANVFGYTGGFSVYAAAAGATQVDTVDASAKAIELARQNMMLNGFDNEAHQYFTMDAFAFFQQQQNKYDVIVLDPPAFAKHRAALPNALKAYRRINEAAIAAIAPGGLLFTFSCSQVVTPEDFRTAVFTAALANGRPCRILHRMTQPADHPINMYHPEGEYLKGLVLQFE